MKRCNGIIFADYRKGRFAELEARDYRVKNIERLF